MVIITLIIVSVQNIFKSYNGVILYLHVVKIAISNFNNICYYNCGYYSFWYDYCRYSFHCYYSFWYDYIINHISPIKYSSPTLTSSSIKFNISLTCSGEKVVYFYVVIVYTFFMHSSAYIISCWLLYTFTHNFHPWMPKSGVLFLLICI